MSCPYFDKYANSCSVGGVSSGYTSKCGSIYNYTECDYFDEKSGNKRKNKIITGVAIGIVIPGWLALFIWQISDDTSAGNIVLSIILGTVITAIVITLIAAIMKGIMKVNDGGNVPKDAITFICSNCRQEVVTQFGEKVVLSTRNVPVKKSTSDTVRGSDGSYVGSIDREYTEWEHYVKYRINCHCSNCGTFLGTHEKEVKEN